VSALAVDPASTQPARYTVLRVEPFGVALCGQHLRRLGIGLPGAPTAGDFDRLTRGLGAGAWAVWAGPSGRLVAERRGASRLLDGIGVRYAPSPFAHASGRFAKPASPSPYDTVRIPGVATLLLAADGLEILEACTAAVLAWTGSRLVCVPAERPAVWSTAEAALREHGVLSEAPVRKDVAHALLLVNAVKGACSVTAPPRPDVPRAVRDEVEALLAECTRWPGDLA
jgi:hypothetical protein